METLSQSKPFFVRCIKSNTDKRPLKFDDSIVLRQLRYTGMLATVRIRQSGYSYRVTHEVSTIVHSPTNTSFYARFLNACCRVCRRFGSSTASCSLTVVRVRAKTSKHSSPPNSTGQPPTTRSAKQRCALLSHVQIPMLLL